MQIIVEDEDGEVVKTYELPSKSKPQQKDPAGEVSIRPGVKRVGTLPGLVRNRDKAQEPQAQAESSTAGASTTKPERQGLSRMGTWGFGGKSEVAKSENATEQDDEDDDRRIRFMIGGAGRRLTKEDFLQEILSLDPRARYKVVAESNAPEAMKAMAKKAAINDSTGTSGLPETKSPPAAAGKGKTKSVGAGMTKRTDARPASPVEDSDEEDRASEKRRKEVVELVKRNNHLAPVKPTTTTTTAKTSSGNEPESAAERKRREKALRGVDDVTDAQRGRSPTRDEPVHQHQETAADRRRRLAVEGGGGSGERPPVGGARARVQSPGIEGESAAERRRREAALGVGIDNQDDSDDDDTPRVPPPVARSRGIRFAQSPVRGKK